jgi:hypothetical protein
MQMNDALERAKTILERLENVKKTSNGWTARCPCHDDKHNSLSISIGDDGYILIHDHARCKTERILTTIGLDMQILFPKVKKTEKKVIATYDYTDVNGKLIHQTIRYEPKGFSQRRPDGKGGWIYSLKGIKPEIYNHPKVRKAINKGERVYKPEGEKDCDNLEKLGLTATTSPMGAGKWQPHYNEYLRNGYICIIPDNDEVGKKHSEQVASSLYGIAKSIKIIELPGLPEKGDVTDFFHTNGKKKGLQLLNELVENTPEWKPQKENDIDEWETPLPFDVFNLPKFPTDCLTPWVADYVKAISEETQTPEDMAAVATLGVLSIPCNKVYKVEGKLGWYEPTPLYCAAIARPGERKSAIMTHVTKILYEYESQTNEQLKPEIAKNQTEKSMLEKELERLKATAAKKGSYESRQEALEKAEELETFEDIKPLRLLADDVSPEKLTSLLADNNGRMAIVSAEGGIFDIMSGRYSQNMNIDVFLKAHAGDTLRVDRVGRSSDYIKEPSLSLVLTIQPDVLTGIMQNSSFRGRGLTARFLYSIPTSKVGMRNIESNSTPEYIKTKYSCNLRALLDVKVPETPYIIKLSREAYKLSIDFAKKLEPRLIGDLEHIADWASKLHGAILRIAGILHVAEHATGKPWEHEISKETLSNAVKIGEYFIEHAKAAFAMMGADKNIDGCKYVLKWLEKQNDTELKKRDIFRGNRGRFKEVAEIEPVLKLLCEYGYLKEYEQSREGAGRKPDKIYKVNPLFQTSIPMDYMDRMDTINNSSEFSPISPISPQDTNIENEDFNVYEGVI